MSFETTQVAAASLSILRVAGEDRASFVHNYCTADIKKLNPNQYTEAFFLNHKGKTVCHGFVIARDADLLIVTTAKSIEELLAGLDRYLISSDVQFSDATALWSASFVFGQGSESALAACDVSPPTGNTVLNLGFRLALQAELAGEGFLVLDPAAGNSSLADQLIEKGATRVSAEQFERTRIENQTPWCDSEITDACLPQEFRRDEKAISFTKGCYLGQETVARLDALGHVNRYFVGFEVSNGTLAVGDRLLKDEKKVGLVTSLAEGADGHATGLGFVRVALSTPGETIDLDGGLQIKLR